MAKWFPGILLKLVLLLPDLPVGHNRFMLELVAGCRNTQVLTLVSHQISRTGHLSKADSNHPHASQGSKSSHRRT